MMSKRAGLGDLVAGGLIGLPAGVGIYALMNRLFGRPKLERPEQEETFPLSRELTPGMNDLVASTANKNKKTKKSAWTPTALGTMGAAAAAPVGYMLAERYHDKYRARILNKMIAQRTEDLDNLLIAEQQSVRKTACDKALDTLAGSVFDGLTLSRVNNVKQANLRIGEIPGVLSGFFGEITDPKAKALLALTVLGSGTLGALLGYKTMVKTDERRRQREAIENALTARLATNRLGPGLSRVVFKAHPGAVTPASGKVTGVVDPMSGRDALADI